MRKLEENIEQNKMNEKMSKIIWRDDRSQDSEILVANNTD